MHAIIYQLFAILLDTCFALSKTLDYDFSQTVKVKTYESESHATDRPYRRYALENPLLFSKPFRNIKCRNNVYPGDKRIRRCPVPDDKISWRKRFHDYSPQYYTFPFKYHMNGMDMEIGDANFHPKWNAFNGKVNRISKTGQYNVVDGYPLNPVGRTGITGRGVLLRWGPNFEARVIITRWLVSSSTGLPEVHRGTGRPILQTLTSMKRASDGWTIPSFFLYGAETIQNAIKRMFFTYFQSQELSKTACLNSIKMRNKVEKFLESGKKVYWDYTDDSRNTDNAWVESLVVHCHDSNGFLEEMPLAAGPGRLLKWLDLSVYLRIPFLQKHFLELVAKKMNSSW